MVMAETAQPRGRLSKWFRESALAGRLLPPALLNFVSGLLAGAGINLLTGVATGPATVSTRAIIIDSVVWVVAAVFAAGAAHVAEGAERKADLAITERFTAKEKQAIMSSAAAEVAVSFWIQAAFGAVFVVLAVGLIPSIGL